MRGPESYFGNMLERLFAPMVEVCMAVAMATAGMTALFVAIAFFWKFFCVLVAIAAIIGIPIWRYWDRNIRW